MNAFQWLRRVSLLGITTILVGGVLPAQPPERGDGQPPREGGRGGRGGFGWGFGGGFGGGFGQFGGGRMGGGALDRATLLRVDQVRQELKIEEAQAVTIDEALEAYREERDSAPRLDFRAMQEMSEEERTAAMEKFRKERAELSKKTDELLGALLDETQLKRLDQIQFQARMNFSAIATLKSDDVKEKLGITAEQMAKLDEAEEAMGAEMRNMFADMRPGGPGGGGRSGQGGPPGAGGPGGPGGGFEQMQERMDEFRKKSSEAAMAVLTDDQKAKIEDMKGAAFEIDFRTSMGRGFGGGFGGPGGQGGPGGGRGGRGGRGEGRPGGGGRGERPPVE